MYESGTFVKDASSKSYFSESNWGLKSKHHLLIEDLIATIGCLTEPDWKHILVKAEEVRVRSYRGGAKKRARSMSSYSANGGSSGSVPKKRKGMVINRRSDA